MKKILLILFSILVCELFAQQKPINKNIEVGMMVQLGKCKSKTKNFESMDLYTKTRFPETGVKIDTLTGDGIFENFFAPGDFDAKRLPCEYGNKKYKVATLRIFEIDGKEKRVMILYTGNKLSLIWVEIDKALELKEIIF